MDRGVSRRRGLRARLGLRCAALACLGFACAEPEPEPVETEPPPELAPRLYVSVASTGNAFVNPTRLAMIDLGDPAQPRAATILEGNTLGWVGIARGTESPSGRYIFAKRIRDFESSEAWVNELFLIDFAGDPLGPPAPLALQLRAATAVWSGDETMAAIVGGEGSQESLWTMHVDDGDPRPPARIPIERPMFDTYVQDLRWDPDAEWLIFLAHASGEPRRVFAARHEDRWPVSVEEMIAPGETSADELLWVGAGGRALTANQDQCAVSSFDFEAGVARTLALSPDPGSCRVWFVSEVDGEPAWLAYLQYSEYPYHLRWIALDWIARWIELGERVEVDATVDSDVVFADERGYFYGWDETGRSNLARARVGSTEVEVLASLPPNIPINGMLLNRDQTRLAMYGNLGVLTFALGDDPGPALLTSPLAYVAPWTLHHDRFVQTVLTTPETGHVRVVDLAATPPVAVDLVAELPVKAIASPLDSRVLVHDQLQLFISDTATPGERALIGEPVAAIVHDFMVHVPGVGTYD